MLKSRITFLFILCFLSLGFASRYLNTARIAYYNERDYPRAKKACLEGIAAGHENYELYAILGGCEIGLRNWHEAAQALSKAMGLDSVKTLTWMGERGGEEYYAQAFYFAAQECYYRAEYEKVLDNVQVGHVLDPTDVRFCILKGAALYQLGQHDKAKEQFTQALSVDPDNPDVCFLVAKAFFESNMFDSSIVHFESAQKYYFAEYSKMKRILFYNLNEINKELLQEIITLWQEGNSAALDEVIKNDLKLDEGLDAHITNIEAFYKVTGDLARTYYYLGMSHYYQKENTLALDYFIKTLELRPHEPDALFFAGEISVTQGAYQEAVQYFETLTDLKPDDLAAWFYLGVCRTQTQEFEQAIDIYEQRVLRLDPHHVDAMRNLAYLYNEIGNREKSMEYIRKIDELQEQ